MECPNCLNELNPNVRKDERRRSYFWCKHCNDFKLPLVNDTKQIKIRNKPVEIKRNKKGKLEKVDWIGRGKGK